MVIRLSLGKRGVRTNTQPELARARRAGVCGGCIAIATREQQIMPKTIETWNRRSGVDARTARRTAPGVRSVEYMQRYGQDKMVGPRRMQVRDSRSWRYGDRRCRAASEYGRQGLMALTVIQGGRREIQNVHAWRNWRSQFHRLGAHHHQQACQDRQLLTDRGGCLSSKLGPISRKLEGRANND